MKPERWGEVQRLFAQARELPEVEREAFVRRESAGDEELASEVLRMLRAEPEAGFLAPPEPPAPASGQAPRRLGDFELLEEIGRGGMGVVYRARQLSLGGRIVAVKVLPPSLTLTERQVDRFQREARAAARLHHPNIVTVLTVGAADGMHYFAMDFVGGPNLAEELKRLREEKAVGDETTAHLPSSHAETYFRTVAEIVRQVADALHYAHQHGVVHRDVKPSNLLLDTEGRVRIVDFGLARDEEQGTITKSGELAGTPHYMSPEQARASRHKVDHRTDIYSLGVVLYELLTLRRPFEGRTSQEIIHNILEREAPRIRKLNPRVPRDLEVICTTAMAKEVAERYSSAAELRDDLVRFLSHQAIRARPPLVAQRLLRWARRHRRLLAASALVFLAATVAILATRAQARRSRIAEHIEAIAAARAEGPLSRLPVSRALELRARLMELHEAGAVIAAGEVRWLQEGFEALRVQLRERGLADLAVAKDSTKPEGVREYHRLAGLQTLLRASHLFPEDPELQRLSSAESAYPTIAVRAVDETGNAIPGEVYLREVDVFTSGVGERRFLGVTPLAPTPVLPGYYRVVVVFAAGGFRELICNPGPASMKLELVAARRADEASITARMVPIPGGPFVQREMEGLPIYGGQTVTLEPFWIDVTEVSNADYQRFLVATGHPPPRFWRLIEDKEDFLARHGDFPVTNVSWNDAVAFASWAGKRLLTSAEWNRAAGGPDAWPTPYSPQPDALPLGNVFAPNETAIGERGPWEQYLLRAAPVHSHPEAATPEGVYHMFGNVYELTESMALEPVDEAGTLVPRPIDRFYYGGAWNAVAAQVSMHFASFMGIGPEYLSEKVGFRCARSAAP